MKLTVHMTLRMTDDSSTTEALNPQAVFFIQVQE